MPKSLGSDLMSPRLQNALAALGSGDKEAIHEAILLFAEVATFNRRGIKSDAVAYLRRVEKGP